MAITALIGAQLHIIGVMEIAFVALFVLPATMKLGLILASCYFAGAVATELSHNAAVEDNVRLRASTAPWQSSDCP